MNQPWEIKMADRQWTIQPPYTVDRPAFQRDHEGVLHRLLGRVEAAEEAGEGGEGVARLGAERGLEGEVAQPAALKSTHG